MNEDKNIKTYSLIGAVCSIICSIYFFVRPFSYGATISIYYMEPLDESCEKPTWESIANKFYDGSTGDSIRISVQRYLKKN